jgi:hypothetical protein
VAAFRAVLLGAWLVMVVVTAHAIAALGAGGVRLFVSDLDHPWRAQFNVDFSVHLLLVMTWIAYREREVKRALILAPPVVLGSLYVLPYLVVATVRAGGRVDALLLGRRLSPTGVAGG